MIKLLLLFVLTTITAPSIFADPVVTLSHGGKLRGKQFKYGYVPVDLFLGKCHYFSQVFGNMW